MNHPIYLLISIVIGSSIILILMRTTIFMSENNQEAIQEEIVFQNFVTTQQILEYYLKKVGYKSPINPILEADSTKIMYLCDDDEYSGIDTIEIRLGDPAELSQNPSDFKIILIKNNEEQVIAPYGVTKFKLNYLDVNGNPTTEKLFIRFIIVTLKLENEFPIQNQYLFYESTFIIKPNNLG